MNEQRTQSLFRGVMLVAVVLLGLNLVTDLTRFDTLDLNSYQTAALISLNTVLFVRLTSGRRSTGGR
jgi:hypothetical protein